MSSLKDNFDKHNLIAYRPDIDGLRAIAVACVLVFHAFPKILPSGFVGVDIFFVISGYLISKIIIISLQRNEFNYFHFLSRRILRIFPALLIIIILFLALGVLTLYIDEISKVAKHALSGLLFISNYTYAQEAGYFDSASEVKQFLHLWSLAIEEQFYLLWPMLLFMCYRLTPSKLKLFTIILIVCSFGWTIYQVKSNFINAYYSPLCRAWELLIGAWLALQPASKPLKNNNTISIFGLILIVCGLILISPKSTHPGFITLLPVCGCALLIYAGPNAFLNKVVLSNRYLVAIGKFSFPLYLWHWPILSFLTIQRGGDLLVIEKCFALLGAVLLSWLTFRYVESPIRQTTNPRKTTLALLSAMAVMVCVAGGVHKWGSHFYSTLDPTAEEYYAMYANDPPGRWLEKFEVGFRNECNFFQVDAYHRGETTNIPRKEIAESCYTPAHDKEHRILIWGDSHAQMLNPGLTARLPPSWQLLQVASSGCVASINDQKPSSQHYCVHSNWFALDTVKRVQPDVVIIAQSQGHNNAEMKRTAAELLRRGAKQVLFMGPSPHWTGDLPKIVVRRLWPNIPERTRVGIDVQFMLLNEKLKSDFINTANSAYVDLIDMFCNPTGCLVHLGSEYDFELTSWDYGHLTPSASDYAAKRLLPIIIKK